jgi:hypothetical protein
MRSRTLLLCVLVLLVVLLLALPCVSLAQTNQPAWETLHHLQPGQNIQIIDTSSKKHSGKLLNVSDSAISLSVAAGEQSLQKQDVRTVKVLGAHRGKNALIGAAVGGGAGALIGAAIGAASHQSCASTTTFCLDPLGTAGQAGIGAAIGGLGGAISGAIIGALVPSHDTAYTTVPH